MSRGPYQPEGHRWRCKTCNVAMSTDNLVDGLSGIWDAAHAGHEIEEEHPLFPTTTPSEPQSPMDEYLARMGEL